MDILQHYDVIEARSSLSGRFTNTKEENTTKIVWFWRILGFIIHIRNFSAPKNPYLPYKNLPKSNRNLPKSIIINTIKIRRV